MESRPKRRKGHSLYNNNNRLDFLLFFSPLQKKKQKSKWKERVRPHPRLPACSFFVISTTTIPPTTPKPRPTTTTLPPTTSLPSLWLNICLRLVLPPSGYPTHQPTSNYNILSSCFFILFFFMLLFFFSIMLLFFVIIIFVSSSRSPLLLSYVLLSARLFALARDLLFPRPVFLESTFCKLTIVEINLTNCCLDESPYAPLFPKEKKKDCQHLHAFNWLGHTRWYN